MIFFDTPISYFKFENLSKFSDRIVHFITTRNYLNDSNFSIGLNDFIPDNMAIENREALANQFNLELNNFVFANQIHSNKVTLITDIHKGLGTIQRETAIADTDAMITNYPNICIMSQSADCVPILFYDPVKNVIASAHAGWKGTVARIAENVVKYFVENYNSNPTDLVVGIGPCIGTCCYEVGEEVIEQAKSSLKNADGLFTVIPKFKNPVFDLVKANYNILIELGLNPENIETANICTKCNNEMFFSARAGDKGRFGAFISLEHR